MTGCGRDCSKACLAWRRHCRFLSTLSVILYDHSTTALGKLLLACNPAKLSATAHCPRPRRRATGKKAQTAWNSVCWSCLRSTCGAVLNPGKCGRSSLYWSQPDTCSRAGPAQCRSGCRDWNPGYRLQPSYSSQINGIWKDCDTLQKTAIQARHCAVGLLLFKPRNQCSLTPHGCTWTLQEVPAQVPLTMGNSTLLQRVMERQPKSKTCEDQLPDVAHHLQIAENQIYDCQDVQHTPCGTFALDAGV